MNFAKPLTNQKSPHNREGCRNWHITRELGDQFEAKYVVFREPYKDPRNHLQLPFFSTSPSITKSLYQEAKNRFCTIGRLYAESEPQIIAA